MGLFSDTVINFASGLFRRAAAEQVRTFLNSLASYLIVDTIGGCNLWRQSYPLQCS